VIVSDRGNFAFGGAVTTCFERTNLVLQELSNDAENQGIAKVDDLVRAQLASLTGKYSALNHAGRARIDYSSLPTQMAYVYRCAATHGDWLYKGLLNSGSLLKSLINGKPLKVACVGGGPGSDMLGVLKFLERQAISPTRCELVLLDYEKGWFEVWKRFCKTVPADRRPKVSFTKLDLAGGDPWTANLSFLDADVFTFSFSLSECWVFNGQGSVTNFVKMLAASMKKGALLVYNDNGGPSFTPNAELAISGNKDLRLISSFDDDRFLISGDEQISAVANFKERFGQNPKMFGNVSHRVWQKCR
jgi:hypothetical protein